jgi:ABC-type sugar transport system ATPase subunit
MQPILQIKGILKDFPGVRALSHIDLDLYPSEVHGLVGENGAGKSTLLKILSGALQRDQGEIRINSIPVSIPNPKASQDLGITVIYQDFNLVPHISVARNIFLGHESQVGTRFILNKKLMNQKSTELLTSLGIQLDPRRLVADLTVAEKQMVEIARALSLESKIVLMDEPSGPLSEHEVNFLFKIIQALKEKGVAIVYVSHRLEEIFQIADRISILRDGSLIRTQPISEIDLNEVIRMMVGREISDYFPKQTHTRGEVILEVKGNDGDHQNSLSVHAGEVVGIAGLVGSGRTELAHMLFGVKRTTKALINFNNKSIRPKSPWEAIQLGIGMVPEDRKEQGIVAALSLRENITLPIIHELCRWLKIDRHQQNEVSQTQVSQLKIQTHSIHQAVQNLSGGNQQKVVLAKWLAKRCQLLIMDEPTRGIDVGAKAEMYKLMNALAADGKGILLISSDLPEVIAMSDRIYVMRDGRLVAELPGQTTSQETIIKHITQGEEHARN